MLYSPFQTDLLPTQHQLGGVLRVPVKHDIDNDCHLNFGRSQTRAAHCNGKGLHVSGNATGS